MKEETNLLMVSMTDSPLYCLIHSSSASKSTHTYKYLWKIEKKEETIGLALLVFLTFLNSNFKHLAPYGFVGICIVCVHFFGDGPTDFRLI
jgi:hypothetical protein